ncbi:hypothetical protein Tco_0455239 [Tanacetum coccineum]
MTTPSPSPPISLSPPSAGERLARCTAPPAHSSPLLPSSGCPTQIQTLRIASTQALIDAVTAALPLTLLPPLPPSLYIPPPVNHRDDIPESDQPPRKRLYLSTLGSNYETGESSTARPTRGRGIDYGFVSMVDAEERRQRIRDVGYGIRDTWVGPAKAVPEIAPMTVGEVNTRVTKLAELHEHDTQDLYALLEDAQDSRSRISQRVDMDSQRVDLLIEDKMTLQETVWMVRIYQKSHKNSQKQASTDTRIRRVQKEAKESKPKPEKSSLSVQVLLGSKKCHSPSLIGPIPKEECHVVERKAQVKKKIALVSLTKEAQAVTSRNDSLAILRCTQYDQAAINHLKMIKKIEGMRLKIGEQGKRVWKLHQRLINRASLSHTQRWRRSF